MAVVKILKKCIFIGFVALLFFSSFTPVYAADECGADSGNTCLENPLGAGVTSAPKIIGIVIQAALGIVGALTLFMFVWGGFQWLTSAGNSEKVEAGTQTIVWAVIGVAVVFSGYIVIRTFTDYLSSGSVPAAPTTTEPVNVGECVAKAKIGLDARECARINNEKGCASDARCAWQKQ